ncbi:MAG: hypothetical protein ACP5KG_11105, partial [Myxococcota bacterium]
ERNFRYFKGGIYINAVQICVITTFAVVPTNVYILRFWFIILKNTSICQMSLYMAGNVVAQNLRCLVISSITSLFASSHTSIRLN